jgi:hypothetical protein
MLSVGAAAVKIAETASSLNLLPLERGKPMLMGESGGDLGGGVGGRSVSLDLEKTRPNDNFRTIMQTKSSREGVWASRKCIDQS